MTEQEKEELRRKMEARKQRETTIVNPEKSEESFTRKPKKWLYVIVTILLCGLTFGAGFYYSNSVSEKDERLESEVKEEPKIVEKEPGVDEDEQTPLEKFESELQETYGKAVSLVEGTSGDEKILYVTYNESVMNEFSTDGVKSIMDYLTERAAEGELYGYILYSTYGNDGRLATSMLINMTDIHDVAYIPIDWIISEKIQRGEDGFIPSSFSSNSVQSESEPVTESGYQQSSVSVEYSNALEKAKSYLDFTSFSYEGLFDQLKFNQFSDDAARYAVDNCGADWNEQAAKKAQSYMEFTSFSRGDLIDQLVFDGFTQEQAEYGASAVGY